MFSSNQIQSEVEDLRSKFEDTQELYREVCTLLFFRYGITPTANKLYQLVRKGSMSAPAEALVRFWETLREKSRIRIEHPDLPDTLRDTAGQAIGALWQQAQTLAQESLKTLRQEAHSTVQVAQAVAEEATLQTKEARKSLEKMGEQLRNCEEKLRITEQKLAKERGEKTALQRQLDESIQQRLKIEATLGTNQQEFATQLECQRATAAAVEERYRADLKRILQAVDREQSNVLMVQEELKRTRDAAARQQHESQNTLRASQQEFTAELKGQRTSAAAAEKRHNADLQRVLQELDRERSNLLNTRKHLEQVRDVSVEQSKHDCSMINALQQERTKLSQKIGKLEGTLAEVRAMRDMYRQQLKERKVLQPKAPKKIRLERASCTHIAEPV